MVHYLGTKVRIKVMKLSDIEKEYLDDESNYGGSSSEDVEQTEDDKDTALGSKLPREKNTEVKVS